MNSKPLVSVVMSVYNAQWTLAFAIDSVLQQTYSNFEFIIINDGSTDNTFYILNKYKSQDSRIIVIDQKNQGLTKSLNVGINVAKGEYIARQDADDISLRCRLEKQIHFLENRKDVVLLGARAFEISKNKKVIGRFYDEEDINEVVFLKNPIVHTSAFFRKNIFQEIGLYNEKFLVSQDFEAWIRLAEVGRIAMLDDVLVEYHIHEGSVSSTKRLAQCVNSYRARKNRVNFMKNINLLLYQYSVNYLPNWLVNIKRALFK